MMPYDTQDIQAHGVFEGRLCKIDIDLENHEQKDLFRIFFSGFVSYYLNG